MEAKLYIYLFDYFIVSSLLRFAIVVLFGAQHPKHLGELRVRRIVNYGSLSDCIHLVLAILFFQQDIRVMLTSYMFFGIDFEVYWSIQSIIFLYFSIIVIGIINRFSVVYLYRDPFFFKFFSLIHLLQFSLCLLILTRGTQSIFIGWEFMGLSSILLIAFYEYRVSVLKNSLIILVIYKVSDVLLYASLIYLGSIGIYNYDQISNPYCLLVLAAACLIKSSVLPWFWLPRAVEGPTQSTAVFYGGLATHIPVYLFMNMWQERSLDSVGWPIYVIISFIICSIICSNLLSQRVNDVKNAIAYSAITQLGIIYLEIIFGYSYLAMIHCVLHGLYRMVEFLKAPSMIYSRQLIEKERKYTTSIEGKRVLGWVPKGLRIWFYGLTYREFIAPRVLVHLIENFMGLYSSHINGRVMMSYIGYSLISILFMGFSTELIFENQLTFTELGLMGLAYLFNFLALLNKYNPRSFFLSLCMSVSAILLILINKVVPGVYFSVIVFIPAMIYVSLTAIRTKATNSSKMNFRGVLHKSTEANLLVLIVGLSIIGMPGLGTFFIWHRLEHALIDFEPGLIINCYVLLTLNTITFFRFYYANYLGKHDVLKQIQATDRL